MNHSQHNFKGKYNFFDRRNLNFLKSWWLDIDKTNFTIVVILITLGLVCTATSSHVVAKKIDVDRLFFIKKQIVFACLSLFLVIVISFLQQEQIKLLAVVGICFSFILLLLVLLVGSKIKGATRWLNFSGFNIQPSEFAKTFFIIFHAYCFAKLSYYKPKIKYISSFLLLTIFVVLLYLQPDFGMIISFVAIWAAQLFLYGVPLFFVFSLLILFVLGAIMTYLTLPHVEDRINRFLDVNQKNYQVERSLDAFANGSFFGKGIGNGVVKKFVPDVHTDFIFASIAEEFGILFCIFIILLFIYLIARIVYKALSEKDYFVYLSLCGLMIQFTMQVMVNIGVSLGLFPTKGMTLPFISYGGSSMLATGIAFGLILAFTKKKYHLKKNNTILL
jgi:cell division protein FtsW